jgi:hypothetical protein
MEGWYAVQIARGQTQGQRPAPEFPSEGVKHLFHPQALVILSFFM